MLNLLDEPVIRIIRLDGAGAERVSLPELLVRMAKDEVASLPALRAHQRFAWHAFLVQLAVIALHRAGRAYLPDSPQEWADFLRALTPGHLDDSPWCLVAPPDRPALLQAPVAAADLASFKAVPTPDALDMLVTSRNHDLKRAVMGVPEPDDWLMALISKQTQEGVMGAGKYGIARMNGGYGSRGCFTLTPPGGPGAWWRRDVMALLAAAREEICVRRPGLCNEGGIALLWLEPWPDCAQLGLDRLDPLFIEICRRIRLVSTSARGLSALEGSSGAARIAAKHLAGNVGDPWAPIDRKVGKCFSVTETGYGYRTVLRLLGNDYARPVLGDPRADDPEQGLQILATSVARGQGKTEGYHERRIPISRTVRRLLGSGPTDSIAAIGRRRVEEIGLLENRVLRPALYCLLRDGKEVDQLSRKQRDGLDRKAGQWVARLDRRVDAGFFPALWTAVEAESAEERERIGQIWLRSQIEEAARNLDEACRSVPLASIHRYRARTRAKGLFEACVRKQFPQLYPEKADDRADAAA